MEKGKVEILDSLSDKELVSRLIQDDEQIIEYLFYHKWNVIFQRLLKDIFSYHIQKEELISDFFLYLSEKNWLKLRQFEFKASLNTWITVVAVNFFKKKKIKMTNLELKKTLLYKEIINEEIINEDSRSLTTDIELLDAILKISNPRYRYVLLAYIRGSEVNEMAMELSTNTINIYNLLKRSKKHLKEILESEQENGR